MRSTAFWNSRATWGSDLDAGFKHHDRNEQQRGFGHICFSVPDRDGAVRWLNDNKLIYVNRREQGNMRVVAFVKNPDGYWIEIVELARLNSLGR